MWPPHPLPRRGVPRLPLYLLGALAVCSAPVARALVAAADPDAGQRRGGETSGSGARGEKNQKKTLTGAGLVTKHNDAPL